MSIDFFFLFTQERRKSAKEDFIQNGMLEGGGLSPLLLNGRTLTTTLMFPPPAGAMVIVVPYTPLQKSRDYIQRTSCPSPRDTGCVVHGSANMTRNKDKKRKSRGQPRQASPTECADAYDRELSETISRMEMVRSDILPGLLFFFFLLRFMWPVLK
jgi:hypothetical protein